MLPLQRVVLASASYDPQVGRLLTYLKVLARGEIWKRRREEKNRRSRECCSARSEVTTDETEPAIVIEEFLAILTRQERSLPDLSDETIRTFLSIRALPLQLLATSQPGHEKVSEVCLDKS